MPAGGALFGSSATGPGSTGGNKHLVEIRAGKMNLKGRMVYPDNRKGLLYVYQSEDALMHFCWQDRTTAVVEDDLIIFPDDCEFIKVSQCTTGRVYLLRFKSSSRKYFFWMQDLKSDKDEDNCKRINELLNNPSSAVSAVERPDQDLQALLNNMSQSQLMQLFGGSGQMSGLSSLLGAMRHVGRSPALTHRTAPTDTPTTPVSSTVPAQVPNAPRQTRASARPRTEHYPNNIQLADLQNLLQGIASVPPGSEQSPQVTEEQPNTTVDLSSALNNDTLSSIINNPEALQQLQNHLPPIDGNTQETLRSTLASPQFQQAVSQFSSAIESGQMGPVVSQLSVNPEAVAAAASGSMQDFVRALEKEDGKETKKKDDDEDEDQMQLD